MKVKFSNWKESDSGSFYNDEEEIFEISVNESDWWFKVDGKEYFWCVREEYYYDEDGDSKGSSLWVRDNNDNIVISQLMEKNEEFSYDISLKYNITAGNAGNILIIINNDVRGKIGKYGEVIDSFIIDNNFYN